MESKYPDLIPKFTPEELEIIKSLDFDETKNEDYDRRIINDSRLLPIGRVFEGSQ